MFCLTVWHIEDENKLLLVTDYSLIYSDKTYIRLVNFTNIKETFLSKCIFMNYDFLNLNRKLLASHGEFLYMKRGKFAAFFQRSACNFESNIAIQSPLGLHQIRIRHETFSLFLGNFLKFFFTKHRYNIFCPNHYPIPAALNCLTKAIRSSSSSEYRTSSHRHSLIN